MKLQDRLPSSIKVGGKRYKCNLDFRNVLRMMDELGRSDLLPGARDWRALRCIMRHPPRDVQAGLAAVRAICFPDTGKAADGKKLTSFEQDADLIRAAFLQEYGINLWRDKLHWLEFSALLGALPEGSRYSDVLGIRARPMPKATKYNADERAWLAKMKRLYAIHLSDQEQAAQYDRDVAHIFDVLAGMAARAEGDSK